MELSHSPSCCRPCRDWSRGDGFPSAKALGYFRRSLREGGRQPATSFYLVEALESEYRGGKKLSQLGMQAGERGNS